MSQSKGGQRRKNRLPASRARLSSSSKTGSSRFISGANFAKTLDVEILTFDGQVEAYHQIKWPFSNNMATLKCLISLRPSSQTKTAPDTVADLMEQGSPAFEAAMPMLSQMLKAETTECPSRKFLIRMNRL